MSESRVKPDQDPYDFERVQFREAQGASYLDNMRAKLTPINKVSMNGTTTSAASNRVASSNQQQSKNTAAAAPAAAAAVDGATDGVAKKNSIVNNNNVKGALSAFVHSNEPLCAADKFNSLLRWSSIRPIGAGLVNLGNTCFLNATLQCLVHLAPLANYCLSK